MGAAAVFITLIYLAVQIRQNTATVATATYESVMTGFNDINIVMASDPAVAFLFARGSQNPSLLNDEEVVQFNFLVRCYANQWWKLFKLHERGSLPDSEWSLFASEAAQLFETRGFRSFRDGNALFADLYAELDKHKGAEMSNIGIRIQD